MRLLICNGSPRGEGSNSAVIGSWFMKDDDKQVFLNKPRKSAEYLSIIKDFQKIVFIYPLYVDGTPGIVKEFLEVLEDNLHVIKGKEITFILHCGFSEVVHLRIMEKYHNILKKRLELKKVYTILTPGSEGIRLMPPKMTKKRRDRIIELIDSFRNDEELSPIVLKKLAGRETFSPIMKILLTLIHKTGLGNIHWNNQLKANNVLNKIYDKPYIRK